MKKFVKWSLIILLILILASLIGVGLYISSLYVNAKKIKINNENLLYPTLKVKVYDNQQNLINDDNEINMPSISIHDIPKHITDSFISIEDKNFYKHHGINYKRIAKAILTNIKYKQIKQGASTITQQLVKNSQLTSAKTIDRKIKEMVLASKFEKKYSKNEILEKYLNIIYFGNNCYGIESASNYYFSKKTSELDIAQSALLAGIIKSPAKYSPIKNPENALKRRNLVLNEMFKDKKITLQELNHYKNTNLNLNLNNTRKNKLNSYSQACIDEAENILKLPARQIALNKYKIYSYQDCEKQKKLELAFKKENITSDSAGIVIDNKKHQIVAFIGESNYKILEAKRQPGSCIKPILVYAPAINEDIITPATQIKDEKLDIANYTPKNADNKYHGYVSARDSLSHSINIPAIKILSYTGIEKAKNYAKSMGIEFCNDDNNYSLALGGMKYGVTIQQLANAYTTFPNHGEYAESKFISFITDDKDNLVYLHTPHIKSVLREDSAYLITNMLQSCVRNGTSRKLSSLNINIASKTGTVGKKNSKENNDAWNVSFTDTQTCAIWLGNLNNNPIAYAGGNQPTIIAKNFFKAINDKSVFEKPSCICEKEIDSIELINNHRVMLINENIPERYRQKEVFSIFNLPKEYSKNYLTPPNNHFDVTIENSQIKLSFVSQGFLTYDIYKNGELIKTISNENKNQILNINSKNKYENIEIQYYYTNSPLLKNKKLFNLINEYY